MVGRVQEHLEAIYGFRCELRATEFIVDEHAARQLGATGRAVEELLLCEDSGDLELALYFSSSLIDKFKALESSPLSAVLDMDLSGYCQLTEGVSHFLYVVNSASQSRQVSLLELEAQAEIDKFATCALAHWNEGLIGWATTLVGRLFEQASFNPQLTPSERWRYEEANRLACGYSKRLVRLMATHSMDQLLGELRYSYRLGAEAKLRYLGSSS